MFFTKNSTKSILLLLSLLPIALPHTKIAATTEDKQADTQEEAKKKEPKLSLESDIIKAELVKKDFYQDYRKELPPNLHTLPEDQRKAIKKDIFIDYKYKTLGKMLKDKFLEPFTNPIICLSLLIGWYLYCLMKTSFSPELDQLLGLVMFVANLYPVKLLFGGNQDLHKKKAVLLHLGLVLISVLAIQLLWDPIGHVVGVKTFSPAIKDLSGQYFAFIYGIQPIILLAPWSLSITLIIAYIIYWREKVITYLKFLQLKERFFVDEMQEAELLYIYNQERLDLDLQKIIENKLFEARKYPVRRVWIYDYILNAVMLPTDNEMNAPLDSNAEDIDLTGFEGYHPEVQDEFIEIYLRWRAGKKLYYNYLIGPPGVGKTSGMRLLAEKIGAGLAVVSVAGASAEDLLGRAPTDTDPGSPGRIFEAIKSASPYGKTPVILFIDEVDKALQGTYAKEIEDLFLTYFERNNKTFTSYYLVGYQAPLPNIIVFAGNYNLSRHMQNRVKTNHFRECSWETKERIMLTKIFDICDTLHIDPETVTDGDLKAIHQIIAEIKKEAEADPNNKKFSGLREIERRIYKYFEKREMKKKEFARKIKKYNQPQAVMVK